MDQFEKSSENPTPRHSDTAFVRRRRGAICWCLSLRVGHDKLHRCQKTLSRLSEEQPTCRIQLFHKPPSPKPHSGVVTSRHLKLPFELHFVCPRWTKEPEEPLRRLWLRFCDKTFDGREAEVRTADVSGQISVGRGRGRAPEEEEEEHVSGRLQGHEAAE